MSPVGVLNFVRITGQILGYMICRHVCKKQKSHHFIGKRVNLPSHQGKKKKNHLKVVIERKMCLVVGLINWISSGMSLICHICQFLWYKYFYYVSLTNGTQNSWMSSNWHMQATIRWLQHRLYNCIFPTWETNWPL